MATRLTVLALLCALLGSTSASQAALSDFQLLEYIPEQGMSFRYALYVPPNLDPNKEYPMWMWLHSSGHTTLEGSAVYPDATIMLNWAKNQEHPGFMIVPQMPSGSAQGFMDSVANLVLDLAQDYPMLEPTRTYASGWSLGGWNSFAGTAHRPDVFAASAPMAGVATWGMTPELIAAGSPVWAFIGGKDYNGATSVAATKPTLDAAIALGGPVMYTIYPEAGHIVGNEGNRHPGLFEWMSAQRAGQPHDVSMLLDVYLAPGESITVDAASGRRFFQNGNLKGDITLASGGSLQTAMAQFGPSAGTTGSVTVQDGGYFSTLYAFTIGQAGTGSLTLQPGATADIPEDVTLGLQPTGQGTLSITGSAIELGDRHITIGQQGAGTLDIGPGGRLQSSNASLARAATASASVRVHGAGATWQVNGILLAGDGGPASIEVLDGGRASSPEAHLGRGSGAVDVRVAGGNARWSTPGTVMVGMQGAATVTVQAGGAFEVGRARLGTVAGVAGTVRVEGGSVNATELMEVGVTGPGRLEVTGGIVQARQIQLASSPNGSGVAEVRGPGAIAFVTHGLFVGGSNLAAGGPASLTVADSGLVVSNSLHLWRRGRAEVQGGKLIVGTQSAAAVAPGTLWIASDGQLSGEGTAAAHLVNAGRIDLRTNGQALRIEGSYLQQALGRLTLRLENPTSRLTVTGAAPLGGTQTRETPTSLQPTPLQRWLLIEADGGASGQFSQYSSALLFIDGHMMTLAPKPGPQGLWAVATWAGDANFDGRVNEADRLILQANWNAVGVGFAGGDFNGDGVVNDADRSLLDFNFGAVPEPTALALLALAALGLRRRR